MTPAPVSKDEKLRALRARFAADLPGLVDGLDRACLAAGGGQAAAVQEAYRHAHTLAGTAATFGFAALAEEARALEAVCRRAVEAGGVPPSGDVVRLLAQVRAAAQQENAP